MPYRHIVLFRVRAGVDERDVDGAIDRLRGLAGLPGVAAWRVERSLDTRKGTVIVEEAEFADRATYVAFRAHPLHQQVAGELSRIADWWVGDYVTD